MTIYEANYYLGLWPFKTKEELDEAVKPEGFLAKHPLASLVIAAVFGYAVVKATLLFLRLL